jgi:hypothetical protein
VSPRSSEFLQAHGALRVATQFVDAVERMLS